MQNDLKKVKQFKLLTPAKGGEFRKLLTGQNENSKHHLNARIVYSFLAYRTNLDLACSIREIARETTLHQNTVKNAISLLGDLVASDKGKWSAVEPPAGLFAVHGKRNQWYDRLAYTKLYLPRKGAKIKEHRFSINHAAVYSIILNLAKNNMVRRYTAAGIGNLLSGLNPKTVSSIVEQLEDVELIRVLQKSTYRSIQILPLNDEHLGLFAIKEEPTEIPESSENSQQTTSSKTDYQYQGDQYDAYREMCVGHMSQEYCEQAIVLARKLDYDDLNFRLALDNAMKQNNLNVEKQKVSQTNFGKYFVMRLQTEFDKAEKKYREEQALLRQQKFLDSDEGRKLLSVKQAEIDADPLNPRNPVDANSIMSRVQIDNEFEAESYKNRIRKQCGKYVRGRVNDIQKETDDTGDLTAKILRQVLHKLNHYHGKNNKAVPDEFQSEIDKVMSEYDGLELIQWPTKQLNRWQV